MKQTIDAIISLVGLALIIFWVIGDMRDFEKRISHLEFATIEPSRCVDNKTFSLINLRP